MKINPLDAGASKEQEQGCASPFDRRQLWLEPYTVRPPDLLLPVVTSHQKFTDQELLSHLRTVDVTDSLVEMVGNPSSYKSTG